jgi:hypothetical protein
MRTRRFGGAARGVAALAVAAAAIGVLTLGPRSPSPDFVWQGPAGVRSPGPQAADALRATARVLTVDYHLPLPSRLVARSYGTRDDFERGLMLHAFLEPRRAARLAGFAAGVAVPGSLLLRESTPEPTPDWIRLVAHELTHVAQMELAGGDAPAARWLGEGMAEWVAYQVVDRSVQGAFDAHRRRARGGFCATAAAGPLDLASLAAPEAFVAQVVRAGAQPTYDLAFHLVDRLAAHDGLASLRAYFGAFRESMDPAVNFEAAFGLTLGDFEREIARIAPRVCEDLRPAPAPQTLSGGGPDQPEPGVPIPVARAPVVPVHPPLVLARDPALRHVERRRLVRREIVRRPAHRLAGHVDADDAIRP